MVDVLVILDGASEPLGIEPTSLELARTPTLDALASAGTLTRVRTVPDGLPVGSETAICVLLGWTPPGAVDRGMLEASARDIGLPPGRRAWRVDVVGADGVRADVATVRRAASDLGARLPQHDVRAIGGHRFLVTGPPPLPAAVRTRFRIWSDGVLPPRILSSEVTMVCARGAAAGIGRLMGATVVVPDGANGSVDTDLAAKSDAAIRAIASGASQVVVHVAAADEAAHERDAVAKINALERIDELLLAPLVHALRLGATLRVCPDHGCDPATGAHCGEPVPMVTWTAGSGRAEVSGRLTERTVSSLPVVAMETRRAS